MVDRRVGKGVKRGKPFEIEVDGEKLIAYEGESVAAVLVAAGRRTFRWTEKKKQPRGMYCGIGLCHDCMMVINGVPNTKACQTLATPGCRVESQQGLGTRGPKVRPSTSSGPSAEVTKVKNRETQQFPETKYSACEGDMS